MKNIEAQIALQFVVTADILVTSTEADDDTLPRPELGHRQPGVDALLQSLCPRAGGTVR